MDQEVAKTLTELELKLQALEHELTTIGGSDAQAQPKTPGGLVDEAVERESNRDQQPNHAPPQVTPEETAQASLREDAAVESDGFGGPAVFGGEEVPAQAGATVERDWTVEIRETAYGEIPTPPAPPSPPPSSVPPGLVPPSMPPGVTRPSLPPAWPPAPDPRRSAAVEESRVLDLAELVRFRDKLARTMDDLIDEYSKLLPAEPLPPRRPQQ